MIETQPVTAVGQIRTGDVLVIEAKSGVKIIAVAKKVIHQGRPTEEIVISKKTDHYYHYFIMEMMLSGKSWARNVLRIPGAKMTADTNTVATLKSLECDHASR